MRPGQSRCCATSPLLGFPGSFQGRIDVLRRLLHVVPADASRVCRAEPLRPEKRAGVNQVKTLVGVYPNPAPAKPPCAGGTRRPDARGPAYPRCGAHRPAPAQLTVIFLLADFPFMGSV